MSGYCRVMYVLATLMLIAGPAQAGQAVQSFSVNEGAPTAAVATTAQGVKCPLGIATVKGLEAERFEFEDTSYSMNELVKALRKANKPTRFDCVVINGGTPDSRKVMSMIKALTNGPIHHVEWGGSRPATSQGAN